MDPNYKTTENIEEGTARLTKLRDFRKFFSDTIITTTHLLKKCIKVPKLALKSDFEPDGITDKQYEELIRRRKIEPFKRGVMNFDDYNYSMYNKFLLIDPDRDEDDPDKIDLGDFKPTPIQINKKKKDDDQFGMDDKVSQLTEQFLEESCQDSYKHDLLDADTPEEKEA